MGRIARHLLLPHVVLLLAGCASVGPGGPGPAFRGESGPVAWEVVDIGQVVSTDTQRMRWSYTIVLKEMAGSAIQFERLERGSYGGGPEMIGGAPTTLSFQRTLPANSEIREAFVDTWGWAPNSPQFGGAATLRPLTVERRFVGKDAQGRGTTVIVRVQLDRSVGKLAKPVPATSPALPSKTLQPSDLATLGGTWRGSYRALLGDSTFDIPMEITLRPDGSFEAGENDPVTNRFRGTLRVQDGKVAYSQRNDSGTLTVHEGDGRRIIFGQVSGPRGSPPTTFSYTIRLEAAAAQPTAEASAVPVHAARDAVIQVVEAYARAVNSADVPLLLSYFADGAQIDSLVLGRKLLKKEYAERSMPSVLQGGFATLRMPERRFG